MNYIIYCRKSTDTEDRQVASLESQEKELLELAAKHGLHVVKILRESKSAKAEGRPVFASLLSMIQRGRADAILCWKLDRLARNMADGGRVIDLLQRSVIKEIRTHDEIHRPSDNVLMIAVQLGMANQYIRDLSENVKRGIRTKLEHGVWHNTAPLGYQNDKTKKTIVLDPAAAPLIPVIFELYASGNYNLRTLTKTMYEKGLRTKAGRNVDKTGIRRILQNPFYYGMMMSRGVAYEGKHEPLISKELFDRANDVLSGKHQSKRQTHMFPLRGFLKCAVCGCGYTATLQKGKYVYYYCTNGKGVCSERKKHLTADDAVSLVIPLFEKLQVDEEMIDLALRAEAEDDKMAVDSQASVRLLLQRQLDGVNEQQDALARRKDTPEDVYTRNMASLRKEQVDLELQLARAGVDEEKEKITFEQVKEVFLKANSAAKAFSEGDPIVQREYAETILSNVSVKSQTVADFLLKPAYQRIADITHKDDLLELRSGRFSNDFDKDKKEPLSKGLFHYLFNIMTKPLSASSSCLAQF